METGVFQVCGKAGRAGRDVQGGSVLPTPPAASTPGSRLEVTCHSGQPRCPTSSGVNTRTSQLSKSSVTIFAGLIVPT